MATKKSIETRRKVAGKILHTPKAEGTVTVEQFNEVLADAKKLAGSILSSKEPRGGLLGIFGGSRH